MDGLEIDDTSSFYHPIKKNKVAFFTHDNVANSSKEKVMKEECQLFCRLFISCQVRQINLEEFFKHENQAAPASLSDNGKLHTSQKSQSQSGLTLPEREPEGGRGIRRRVTGTTKTPQNWRSFLRDDSNKTELFNFLADKMCDADTTSTIIVTRGDNAICNKVRSLDAVAPCSHEEADTRVFVHARDATSQGSKSITIKANDTDVVVIAVSTMPSLQELGLEKLWIAFGQGASARWTPVHDVVSSIGPEKVGGILFFHAFTGCDVVSGFRGPWQREKNLHGRHGMYVRMLPKPSRNSATVRKKFQMMTCRNWRTSLS